MFAIEKLLVPCAPGVWKDPICTHQYGLCVIWILLVEYPWFAAGISSVFFTTSANAVYSRWENFWLAKEPAIRVWEKFIPYNLLVSQTAKAYRVIINNGDLRLIKTQYRRIIQ